MSMQLPPKSSSNKKCCMTPLKITPFPRGKERGPNLVNHSISTVRFHFVLPMIFKILGRHVLFTLVVCKCKQQALFSPAKYGPTCFTATDISCALVPQLFVLGTSITCSLLFIKSLFQ